MRNISLWKQTFSAINGSENASVTAVAFDTDDDALYLAVEQLGLNEQVEVQIWRVGQDDVHEESTCEKRYIPVLLATVPSTSSQLSQPDTVSLHLHLETRSLVLVNRGGDLTTFALEEEPLTPEVVGSVESGIRAVEWSPDDTLLVLITGDDKIILMTSTFDVLSEQSLDPSEFGEDTPAALGWGTKETQFHGSAGKAAARSTIDPASIGSSPDDDQVPRISWRGDGAFYVVSTLTPPRDPAPARRTLRVYSRDGTLSSTSEPIAGLEHPLSWRPSGNLIASTQRFGSKLGLGKGPEGRHDLVLFERNGLRHGEFGLREIGGDYHVREVGWNADSTVLSIWISKKEGDIVQLWTTGNYHWYLKQTILAPGPSTGSPAHFTTVQWHPEDPLCITLTTRLEIIQRTYAWETYASHLQAPHDTGGTAVIDGATILLTPFRTQNIPPPMSSSVLTLSSSSPSAHVPVHAAFSPARDQLGILWESGLIELFELHTRIGPGSGKVVDPARISSGMVSQSIGHPCSPRQLVLSHSPEHGTNVAVLSWGPKGDVISVVHIRDEFKLGSQIIAPARDGRLVQADDAIVWQGPEGDIHIVNESIKTLDLKTRFPEFCFDATRVLVSLDEAKVPIVIGLARSGKLHLASENADDKPVTLASNVNSFTVASNTLIYTTTAHVAHFAPLRALPALFGGSSLPEWETRRVERGSRIVTAVPSAMSLVLQMPRGNLETVYPRPLVLEVVKQDIDLGNYSKAFTACRKHRVDLNVLVEHNREAFLQRIPSFVQQVSDVDYINLFLTSLGQGSLPAETVGQLCDGIRVELERIDMKKYIYCILTAHVVKRPPDHEAGLALLLRLRDSEPQLVEDAVKYIIFLVDAERLFDTALGMYDFSLVLMIAQHAQKDPREYLPFLRELRALDHYYQRFKIDDHLKRYEKALLNLSLAGPERFQEAIEYTERHQLYDSALSIWKDSDRYDEVLTVYGDWLFERREFREAALIYRQAKRSQKAMLAHEKALEWQEVFELALQENVSKDDLKTTGYRLAEELSSKKRFQDAARVLLDYARDVREAVIALVQGHHFSEARRIITLNSRPELLEDIVHPGTLESQAQILEDIDEMRQQLRKQVQRLRELRVKKIEEPDAFYGVEDMDLHNVDVMTDVSMAPTAFTRYTVAPSAMSRTSSKRSSRSKRKLERKVGSGRKGTVDEEEYLLKSVTKLTTRFNTTQTDTSNLLPHLFQFTEEHRAAGQALQKETAAFSSELREAVDEIWAKPTEGETEDSWAARMEEHERQRRINPIEKVAKPELGKPDWNLSLQDGQYRRVR